MSKKIVSLILAAAFVVCVAGVSMAAKVKCTVESVDGSKVTMDCGSKADDLNAGDKVEVKAKKGGGKKAIEGC